MNQGPPDPHAPESQPTRQDRSRAEDSAAWRKPTNHQENIDKHTAVPAPTGKFASLKRKLFPSQNRRHPRNVPPLISPINAPLKTLLPPLEEKGASLSRSSLDRDGDSDPIQENNSTSKIFDQEVVRLKNNEANSREGGPESDSSSAEVDNNWRGRTLIDDDDDRDLESAVEALDLETSIADKTLEEVRTSNICKTAKCQLIFTFLER
ncbi:unnamed protein product [Phytophthora lilii]|uniref:Unnamed protein product n=1 Tax=Phytophthora lilii TaxID=2077276 RepID=A0A9W6TI14_9STRA|nr:unnamed protein product [Phytophthora lilii]